MKKIFFVCLLTSTLLISGNYSYSKSTAVLSLRDCQVQDKLPDPICTPGEVFQVTKEDICVKGYTSRVRHVTARTKNLVYQEYGITSHVKGEYEVDHFIPLELGGSNDLKNLWPEAAEPRPGFHEKDKVENYLHRQVCAGLMPLAEAQKQIQANWLVIYEKIK
ncbi:MAG: HNH endonuclease signature motif containing protein [Candidatus Parcubacteria bacterium]|nr:HNH endonuclease signature motif containing protein [Candidatus Parcubacteria bacterium]